MQVQHTPAYLIVPNLLVGTIQVFYVTKLVQVITHASEDT